MDQKRREKNVAALEWFDALVFALTFVLLILLFVVRSITVVGTSMLPTLQDGEQLMAYSLGYTPERGDLVVADSYISFGTPLVKRVIGIGGDTIDIHFDSGDVFVNGELLVEPYIMDPTTRSYDVTFPLTVPEGKVFLLGDNRLYSKDSRHSDIGLIDQRDLLGKLFLRVLPFSRFGLVS